jgi:sec-independent protein translocase protein TatB
MFDFSWSEIMVIGGVALVVIGPKDLPKALRTAGVLMRRARLLAREFQSSIDEVIREADLEEAERNIRKSLAEVELPDLTEDHPAIGKPVSPPADSAPHSTEPAPMMTELTHEALPPGPALVEAPPEHDRPAEPLPVAEHHPSAASAEPVHSQHPPAP